MRFVIARLVALITAGNLRTEFGERIYTGLFWHHLQNRTVQREVNAAGWKIVHTVAGSGMSPTFLFLESVKSESTK